MKKNLFVIVISILILLTSCIFFQTINQPSVSLPNEVFTVSITATTEGGEYEPYFGVCLPIGWTIPGDSVQCSGVYTKVIHYDSLVAFEQNSVSPALNGYYWWVGKGVVDTAAIGEVYAELHIQTDSQTGRFFIDFMLGNSYNGVNQQRSDNHIIDVVDEYTPSGLAYRVQGDLVILSWYKPFNTNGLLGFNIYRDEQKINSTMITDTTFYDDNPNLGINRYSISSVYDSGNEYLIPFEISLVYKDLYVSIIGSNNNSGSSFRDALLTIDYALFCITSDSLNSITIHLSEGIFSPSTNAEEYPLEWKNYVSLKGISENETILNGDSLNSILNLENITNASFENVTIKSGVSEVGGGVFCYNSNLILENVTIEENTSIYNGGGIFCTSESNLNLVNVTISENVAGYKGGGIYCETSYASLENTLIIKNEAVHGGGIWFDDADNPNLINVVIADNMASLGGGFANWRTDVTLTNCIVWQDSADEIYQYGYIYATYSDIQGDWQGEGNINEKPLFDGTGDYPYLLSSSSPCIDAGDPNAVYNDPEDPNNPGFARWPAKGTIRNDMGAYGGPYAASWSIVTDVEDDKNENLQQPTEFSLSQNYPNPFNPSTTIQYSIKERSSVELVLYDILGSQVKVLVKENQDAGYYTINFYAGRLASGVYFYRLKAGDFVETRKMILMK